MVLDEAKEAVADVLGFATKNTDADEEDRTAGNDGQEREYPLPPATAPARPGAERAASEEDSPLFAEGARAALLYNAALTDAEDRDARDLALCSLQSLAAGVQNKRQMWTDATNTRPVILNATLLEDPADTQGRCFALGTLWNIAGELANRQDMWADETTRNSVIKAAQCPDAKVHELGMGILWNLSPRVANAAAIWQDVKARTAIVEAAKSEKLDFRQARAFAMAALQNLAEESSNRAEMCEEASGVRVALVAAANMTNPEDKDIRGRAVGALMNLSVAPANKQRIWEDAEGTRAALLLAANLGPGKDDKSWTCALAAMWSLAVEQKNRVAMQKEARVRSAIIEASAPGSSSSGASETGKRARERALATFQYLTTDSGNKEAMWADAGVREALVAATRGPNEGSKLRIYALGALWNLSSCPANQEGMWKDDKGARAAVIEVAKDPSAGVGDIELRERAMAVLWNLSAWAGNKVPMWQDERGARAALLSVIAAMRQEGNVGRSATQYAFGALRNLADDAANRAAMWGDLPTREVLVRGVQNTDADDSVSPKRALKTLCALAYETSNAEPMWKDETGARAVLIKASQGQEGGDKDTCLCALRALQALSVEGANKQSMWQEAGIRTALSQSAALIKPEDHKARVCALSTLKNLTTEASNMEGIWNDAAVRGVLVTAATKASPDEDPLAARARAVAMGALRNVAVASANKEPMWADADGARNAIVAAAGMAGEHLKADAREAREHAIAALRHFSVVGEGAAAVSEPLWRNHEQAKLALIAAAQFSTEEQSDRKARDYAVAALRHAT